MNRTASFSLREDNRAFTLLEILVVLAIMGLLVGLSVTKMGGVLDSGNEKAAGIFVKQSIKIPLTSYRIDTGDYPLTSEGLEALITAPAGKAENWRGPYLEINKVPLDPWQQPYVYRSPGVKNPKGYDIFSKGPDRAEDTADDIGNW